MEHSSIFDEGYSGTCLGFYIYSGEVFDYDQHRYDRDDLASELEESFENFLNRKFDKKVPNLFFSLELNIVYDRLGANYDATPDGYPDILWGYRLSNYVHAASASRNA